MSENPYETPLLNPEVSEVLSSEDAVAVRMPHLTGEALIKAISVCFYLKGIGSLLLLPVTLGWLNGHHGVRPNWINFAFVARIFAIDLSLVVVARGLWKLRPWSKISAIVLCLIGALFPFPDVTLAFACVGFIAVLISGKTTALFSGDYLHAVAKSPQLKYGPSRVTTIILVLFALGLLGFLASPPFSK